MTEMNIRQLQSEALALKLLRRIHAGQDSHQLYSAAARVASTARQAVQFVAGLETIRIELAPLLRYYEWLHWLKTLLYLFDLEFPRSTAVLQHGLSVRRIKRQAYRWPLEAIIFHKDGVLQECVRLFLPGEQFETRLMVGDLLGCLPGMRPSLHEFYHTFLHVYELSPTSEGIEWSLVDREIASNQSLTVEEWNREYLDGFSEPPDVSATRRDTDPPGRLLIPTPSIDHPMLRRFRGRRYLLDRPRHPEWVIHYCLLYSLSALCRYNPVEWSDIVLWQNEFDAVLVREYLALPETQIIIETDLVDVDPVQAIRFLYPEAP
jgi:hypothetical protein